MNKFYRGLKRAVGGLFKRLFRVRIINPQNEIEGVPFIVCSNHTSLFDAVIIMASLKRQIRYMAKKEAFKIPIVNLIMKGCGAFPVDRKKGDVSAIKTTIELLKDGECVGIFPQGTRRGGVNPRETEVKDGIGMLAHRAGVGILPICIRTKKRKLKMFHKTELIIGEYIPPEKIEYPSLTGKEKYKEISQYAFNQVCDMHDNYPQLSK